MRDKTIPRTRPPFHEAAVFFHIPYPPLSMSTSAHPNTLDHSHAETTCESTADNAVRTLRETKGLAFKELLNSAAASTMADARVVAEAVRTFGGHALKLLFERGIHIDVDAAIAALSHREAGTLMGEPIESPMPDWCEDYLPSSVRDDDRVQQQLQENQRAQSIISARINGSLTPRCD